MAISTGDILRVAARLLWNNSSDIVNVFHMLVSDDNSNTLENLIDDVLEAITDVYSNFDQYIPDNVTFADVNIQNVTQDESYGSFSWDTLTAGAGVADPISPGLSCFVYMPTFTPDVQGRKWFGPFQEDTLTDGLWVTALTSAVTTALQGMVAGFTGTNLTDLDYRIPHYVEDGVELVTPQFLEINQAVVSSNPGYQRRRRPGAGS